MKESAYDRDPLPEPAAPVPQSDLDSHVDRVAAVRNAVQARPEASVDEIIAKLAERQIPVSATLVMQELMRSAPGGKKST